MGYADNLPTDFDHGAEYAEQEPFAINGVAYTFDVAPDAVYARAPVRDRLLTTVALYPLEVVNAEVRSAQLERDLGITK